MPAAKQAAASRWGWLRLVLCAAGIYGAYLTQGMVQEDLSTRRCAAVAPLRRRPDAHPARPPQVWGSQGAVHARRVPEPRAERGVHVLVRPVAARAACAGRQRAGTALLAGRAEQYGGPCVRGAGAQKHQARVRRASPSALFSHRSPFAVRSYTAQVLAKSCKLIPVMFARFVLDGKRYSALEYTAATLIAGTSRHRSALPRRRPRVADACSLAQPASPCLPPPKTPGLSWRSLLHPTRSLGTRSCFSTWAWTRSRMRTRTRCVRPA